MLIGVLYWCDVSRMFPFQQWIQKERTIDMEDELARFDVIEEAPHGPATRSLPGFLSGSRDSNATGETDVVIMNNMACAEDTAI